jgi:hypothetical protein
MALLTQPSLVEENVAGVSWQGLSLWGVQLQGLNAEPYERIICFYQGGKSSV